MIRTKPPSNDYRDGWERVFGDAAEAVEEPRLMTAEEANKIDGRFSWPTSHESDCPARIGDPCRCPMGNL